MGTRHLIQVDYTWETKIAQYWQWDWYIQGQWFTILDFLRKKENIEKLRESLKKVRFLDDKWKDKDFIQKYNDNCPDIFWNRRDVRTPEQKNWHNTYISRDLWAEILINIINSKDNEIILRDNRDFKEDTTFCEYYYIINLDKMTLDINWQKVYDINNLPSNEEVLKDFE